jgi:hypothetical protein
MRTQCITAVEKAVGRQITKKEATGIEDRITTHMRLLATKDPAAWRTMSYHQRLNEAAKAAVAELKGEAFLQKRRLELQIAAHDKLMRETGQWEGGRQDALKRLIVSWTDGKGSFQSIETRGQAIRTDALRRLTDAFEVLDPRMLGLFENVEGVRDFTRAVYGETNGIDPKIVKAADEWLKIADEMREQFNQSGGKIGKLEDWALPQHHSQTRVAKAGMNQWVQDIMPRLDRSRYVDEQGRVFTDDKMIAFLHEAWRSIATNGWNKHEPGKAAMGSSMAANRRADHRSIHFKSADDFSAYQTAYGDRGLLQIMVGHIDGLAKETAAIETFGPNADRTYEHMRDLATKEAVLADPERAGRYENAAVVLDSLWAEVRGVPAVVASRRLSAFFDGVRNWMVSTRLGSAYISSLADHGTIAITAKMNNLPMMQVFANQLRTMDLTNGEELRQARRAGLAMDTMIGDLNRFGNDNLASTVPAKLASLTMRLSLLSAASDARRRAFGATMMDAIGRLTRDVDSLAKLGKHDNQILLSKGITEQDWEIWRLATPEQWGNVNDTVLTPDAIYQIPGDQLAHLIPDMAVQGSPWSESYKIAIQTIRREAALKLLGAVAEEVDMAVITPKAAERAMMNRLGAGERGTWKGELARSIFLFKTTPISVVLRHFRRAMARDTVAGRAAYIAAFTASTTLLGAFGLQVSQLIMGKDPVTLDPTEDGGTRNWVRAFLKGGSFGLYGDFLFSGITRHETSPTAAFMGPVIGGMEEFFNLTQGNLVQSAMGENTNAGAEAIRFAKSNIPLANLWYTKAALDHLVVHNLQEMASPGYLSTMQNKMRRQYGETYWWKPGEAVPDEAPDMGKIVGQR